MRQRDTSFRRRRPKPRRRTRQQRAARQQGAAKTRALGKQERIARQTYRGETKIKTRRAVRPLRRATRQQENLRVGGVGKAGWQRRERIRRRVQRVAARRERRREQVRGARRRGWETDVPAKPGWQRRVAARSRSRRVQERETRHQGKLFRTALDTSQRPEKRMAAARTLRREYKLPVSEAAYKRAVRKSYEVPKQKKEGGFRLRAPFGGPRSVRVDPVGSVIGTAQGTVGLSDADDKKKQQPKRSGFGVTAGLPFRAGTQIAHAFYEEPWMTAKGTLYTGPKEALLGLGQQAGKVASAVFMQARGKDANLSGVAKQMATSLIKDYERRYGPLAEGDEAKFRERIKKEGAFGELLDAVTAGTVVGGSVGRVATGTARSGSLGTTAKHIVTKERPALRFSGSGQRGSSVRAQKTSPNLFKARAQHERDVSREVRAEQGRRRQAQGGRRARSQGQPAPGALDAVVAETRRTPRHEGEEPYGRAATFRPKARLEARAAILRGDVEEVVPGPRARKFEQHRDPARQKGRMRLGMLGHQRVTKKFLTGQIGRLDKNEKRALKYAAQLGIRTPEQGAEKLAKHREDVLTNRQQLGGESLYFDELAGIQQILSNPKAHFTPKLAEVADNVGEHLRELEKLDPSLASDQALIRAYAPLAMHLGINLPSVERDRSYAAQQERLGQEARGAEVAAGRSARGAQYTRGALAETGTRTQNLRLTYERQTADRDAYRAVHKQRKAERRDGKPQAEPASAWVARVREAAGDSADPFYWESRKRPSVKASLFAVGGKKANAPSKVWTGALFRTGREDTSTDVLVQGAMRNIKRRFNWNLVAQNFAAHSFDWSVDRPLGELLDEIQRRGIDPDSVVLYNPGRFYRLRNVDEERARGYAEGGRVEGDAVDAETVSTAIQESVHKDVRAMMSDPALFKAMAQNRYSLVPKHVYDEIDATTKPDTRGKRAWEIVLKQKPSRIMLGLFNTSWLQFQVASNAALTALAGVSPRDFFEAGPWWRKLSDKQKLEIEPYLGIGHHHDDVDNQRKLGSTASSNLVEAWQALRAHPVMRQLSKGNPMNLFFRADAGQNNFFRKRVFYSQVKREAYRRMNDNLKGIAKAQDQFIPNVLKKKPSKQLLDELIDNTELLERHAKHVSDFLGDYMTFTAKERKWLQSKIIFWGYLRFSTRFTFYTMPTQHPLMTAITLQLGRLGAEEVKRFLGGNYLPYALGRYYFKRDGQDFSINLARANPALNTLTQLQGLGSLPGLFSPFFQIAMDQVYEKSSFTGRPWRVQGSPSPVGEGAGMFPPQRVRAQSRGMIAGRQLLGLAAPYRMIEGVGIPGVVEPLRGPQSAESLIFRQRPIQYVGEDVKKGIRKREAERVTGWGGILTEQVPWVGEPDPTREVAKRRRQRLKEWDEAQRKRGKSDDDDPFAGEDDAVEDPFKKKRKKSSDPFG